jgi:hypothetical protein
MKAKTTRQRLITTATFAMAVFVAHPAFANSSTPPTISIDSTPPILLPNLPNNTQHANASTGSSKHAMNDGEIAGIAVGSTAGAAAIAGVIRPWQKGSGKLNLTGSAGVSGAATDVKDLSSLSDGALRRLAKNGIGTGRRSLQLSSEGRIPEYIKENGKLVNTGETVSIETASREELVNAINQEISRNVLMLGSNTAQIETTIERAERLALAQEEWAGRTTFSGLIPKSSTKAGFAKGGELTRVKDIPERGSSEYQTEQHGIVQSLDADAAAKPKPVPDSNDDALTHVIDEGDRLKQVEIIPARSDNDDALIHVIDEGDRAAADTGKTLTPSSSIGVDIRANSQTLSTMASQDAAAGDTARTAAALADANANGSGTAVLGGDAATGEALGEDAAEHPMIIKSPLNTGSLQAPNQSFTGA